MGLTHEELREAYDNLWDISFQYKGLQCGIFPIAYNKFPVVMGDNEYMVTSFSELCTLDIEMVKDYLIFC